MMVRSEGQGGFIRIDEAFAARVGFSAAELAARPLEDWLVCEDREVLRNAQQAGDEDCCVRHRTKDGGSALLDLRMQNGGPSDLVLAQLVDACPRLDVEDDTEAEVSVQSTLHRIAKIVEAENPGYKCSIQLVAHGKFVKGAGPSLPEEYNDAIDGLAVGPTVGSCGTAIYWNVPVIVEDIQNDDLWTPFAELAARAGVAACWSHPFATRQGRVLGALALYAPEPRAPTAEQLSRLRAAAQLTGLAVERGRAEEELRIANAVKERFMANLSHEIRTPLNAVIGLADHLGDLPATGVSGEVRLLRDAGEQLLALFSGALELTELRGRQGQEAVVGLRGCLEGVLEDSRGSALEKGLTLEAPALDELPQQVWLDRWAFERALGLLMDNAVKFTDQGRVAVEAAFDGAELAVRVSDSGCGIDLGRLAELRDPFIQGDQSTTKRHAGFGLGLALADLCAKAVGGRLSFSRNASGGTTVELRTPLKIAAYAAEACDPETESLPQREGARVLVVEDNLLNQKVIGRILERLGHDCEYAENGADALKAMEREEFSCVLMDCQMPVMDGYEATRRIRELEAESEGRIPIIAVTANALSSDRDRCLEAGMDSYLMKPVRKLELASVLGRFVATRQPRD